MEHRISPDYRYINMFVENVLYGKGHKLESEDLIVMELNNVSHPILDKGNLVKGLKVCETIKSSTKHIGL